MESIQRGEGVFDLVARDQLAELRRRESAIRVERVAVEALVAEATEAVLARRPRKPRATVEEPVGSPVADTRSSE